MRNFMSLYSFLCLNYVSRKLKIWSSSHMMQERLNNLWGFARWKRTRVHADKIFGRGIKNHSPQGIFLNYVLHLGTREGKFEIWLPCRFVWKCALTTRPQRASLDFFSYHCHFRMHLLLPHSFIVSIIDCEDSTRNYLFVHLIFILCNTCFFFLRGGLEPIKYLTGNIGPSVCELTRLSCFFLQCEGDNPLQNYPFYWLGYQVFSQRSCLPVRPCFFSVSFKTAQIVRNEPSPSTKQ